MKKLSPLQWIWITLAGFVAFGFFFYRIIASAQNGQLSLPVYFVALIVVALLATGFLSGALRSISRYQGKAANGTLYISGPAVIFFVILYLGYRFRPEADASPLSVSILFVNKEGNLLGPGSATIRIGQYSSSKQINNEGQAVFTGINPAYRAQAFDLSVDVKGYAMHADSAYRTSAAESYTNLRIVMDKIRDEIRFQGRVVKLPDGLGISNAELRFQGDDHVFRTDSLGHFSAALEAASGTELRVVVTSGNKEIYNSLRTLADKDFITIAAN
ncbi:MAG: hypothetical protein INR69_08245 [Mucilaginibacter polytrichastri]|nr:hypothetical protein [Mucilaginibacter polytrichastri]